MSRNTKVVVAVFAVIAVGVALFTSLAQGSGSSSLDNGLKRSADHIQRTFHQPDNRYVSAGPFLQAFNLYQANQRSALLKVTPQVAKQGRFVQVIVWETSTMPPVWQLMQAPGKPQIGLSADQINQVAAGKSTFTSVQKDNLQFRVYATPVPVPPSLQAGGTHAVLEVIQAQS